MATSFNNKYTEIANINSGNQLQDGDVVEVNPVNCAIQNTAHLKTLLDNSTIRSATIEDNKLKLTLATKGNNDDNATTTTLYISANDINGLAKRKETLGGLSVCEIANNTGTTFSILIEKYNNNLSLDLETTLLLDISGNMRFSHTDYIGGQTTTKIVSLIKRNFFYKIEFTNGVIYLNCMMDYGTNSISVLKSKLPLNTPISATGYLQDGSTRLAVQAITFTDNDLVITGLTSTHNQDIYTRSLSSSYTITYASSEDTITS